MATVQEDGQYLECYPACKAVPTLNIYVMHMCVVSDTGSIDLTPINSIDKVPD